MAKKNKKSDKAELINLITSLINLLIALIGLLVNTKGR